MFKLKSYDNDKSQFKKCIVERGLTNKYHIFCSRYLQGSQSGLVSQVWHVQAPHKFGLGRVWYDFIIFVQAPLTQVQRPWTEFGLDPLWKTSPILAWKCGPNQAELKFKNKFTNQIRSFFVKVQIAIFLLLKSGQEMWQEELKFKFTNLR